jgi:hypothetical protein
MLSQKKLDYQVELKMFDNDSNILSNIECKEFILTWKYHIDNIASKISKTIDIITRLIKIFCTHVYPIQNIYRCLILPYITYVIAVWGQAPKKALLAVRLMNFKTNKEHAIPRFIHSNILPLNMLYFTLLYFTLKPFVI